MNRIVNLRDGSFVGNWCGQESSKELLLHVEGLSDSTGDVFVNGMLASRRGTQWSAEIPVRHCDETITAVTRNEYGEFAHSLRVVWDRHSFQRYNFFIDDNIFFLTELAQMRPHSIFDHFYLAFLKSMHDQYGTKFTLNLFYRNDHHPFELKDFPDCYRMEFESVSDWLKFAPHAYSEFPDRPYQNTSKETLVADFDRITDEIIRFAGAKSCIPAVALHWSIAKPDSLRALHSRGVRVLCGQFMNARTAVSEKKGNEHLCDIGYYRNLTDCLYLEQYRLLHDFALDLTFMHSTLTCNLWTPAEINSIIHEAAANECYHDTLNLETHEQYSFPDYPQYLPDHFFRIETAIRTVTELGYTPVFIAEGMLGNPT